MKKIYEAEVLICGAGIIGLTIAKELLKKGCDNIVILEKEGEIGRHASGRNSGVLHAGIYYVPNTLRAKSCLNGNFLMRHYCREKEIPLSETGKVIVTKDEKEINILKELYRRARENGAKVELIDEKQLKEIEPYARTCRLALYSYYTAVLDPKAVLKSLYDDLISSGKVKVLFRTEFKDLKGSYTALTNNGEIKFNRFINSAGAYSDRIAHAFGVGLNYRLIPFKGIYKKLRKEKSHIIKGNIYPVPDIRNPFLGVHFTKSIKGDVYLGPTAMPAFGRRNYGVLKDMDLESIKILFNDCMLFFMNEKFRKIALTEPQKYLFKFFFEDARKLVKDLKPEDVLPSNKVGIRPQLVDWQKKELVMDFLVIKDSNTIHILNAISPGFTSSMSFAKTVIDQFIN
ncbi:MAG TPA: L-2-hydroxyglutarate oxidase [Candidatus Atribacteria bacterium]|nr:L-2-hydroxyglutarate oxidase [Candidatus Atribacteria bacterium]